jgi:hypothetical protein
MASKKLPAPAEKQRTKKCGRCKQHKSVSMFCARGLGKTGYESYCRPCNTDAAREIRARKKSGEHRRRDSRERTAEVIRSGIKRCAKCRLSLPVLNFYNSTESNDGFHSYCMTCMKNRYNPEKESKMRKRIRLIDPIQGHRKNLKKYGRSSIEYDKLIILQKGLCGICGLPETSLNSRGVMRRLANDHCHKTGVNRGLLCIRCNTSIERLDSVPGWAEKAASYLEKHRAK